MENKRKSTEHRQAYVHQLNSEKKKSKKYMMKLIIYIKIFRVLLYLLYFGFTVGLTFMNLKLLFFISSLNFILIHYLIFLSKTRRASTHKKIFSINRKIYNELQLKL